MATKSAVKKAIKELEPAFKEIAKRWVDAENSFKADIVEQFGFTVEEANTIFQVYLSKKVKAIKYSNGSGKYQLTHGAFWEKKTMQNALEFASDFI